MENPDPSFLNTFLIFCTEEVTAPLVSESYSAWDVIIQLSSILFLILASAVISGSESAFFSLTNIQLTELSNSKKRYSGLILRLLEKPKKLLATILLTNTFISIAIAIVAGQLIEEMFPNNPEWVRFTVEIITITFTLVLFGEITPKIYAQQKNVQFAGFVAYPIFFLNQIFQPITYVLVFSTKLIENRLNKQGHNLRLEEMRHAIEITSDASTSIEEKKILKGIVAFSTTNVRQVMTSRVDVCAIDIKHSLSEVLEFINENRYSRIPVQDGNLDTIVGVLFIKDLVPFMHESDDFDWKLIMRTPYFVPESKMINDLLEEFQIKKTHLAIVVDEYGGTSGIISMEDILEEIVGEIKDEFDDEDIYFTKISDTEYSFNAKTSLNDVIKIMNFHDDVFEEFKGDAETIGGLVVELLHKIPKRGEITTYKSFIFTVESADKKKIRNVNIKLIDSNPLESETEKA